MTKYALLIGVSQYQPGLNPLPGTADDVKAMRSVLSHSDMGGFDEVQTLLNPEPLAMQEAIELFFSNCKKNDLALLFFSGHGIKDDQGRLYLSTPQTRKSDRGDLIRATAVPALFVQDVMGNSRCRRQVVILDCCFSGAFAEGMTAKESGAVDIANQLGGEGRAVLTSSSSTQYSFEQAGEAGSVYTRYVVEGIETGAADTNNDGWVTVDELHEYARKKVQAAAPAMRPKIYAVEEGFRIQVAQAALGDPHLKYRKEADKLASRGEFSVVGRFTLDTLQKELGLESEVALQIEQEVLKPYKEYQQRLKNYEEALCQTLQSSQSLTDSDQEELDLLRQVLDLETADVDSIQAKVLSSTAKAIASNQMMASLKEMRSRHQETPNRVHPVVPSASSASSEDAPLDDLLSSFKKAPKEAAAPTSMANSSGSLISEARPPMHPEADADRAAAPPSGANSGSLGSLAPPASKPPDRPAQIDHSAAAATSAPVSPSQTHTPPNSTVHGAGAQTQSSQTQPSTFNQRGVILAIAGAGLAIALAIFGGFMIVEFHTDNGPPPRPQGDPGNPPPPRPQDNPGDPPPQPGQ
ncbi:MAG: caspase family protein [Cyanobacteria bacterium P01_D01_bin.128]